MSCREWCRSRTGISMRRNQRHSQCVFCPCNFEFPFPNPAGQTDIEVSCTFHLEQKIVSCIMYNEIWTYCQRRDIAVRDVPSYFIFGRWEWASACISPWRLNDNRSISQLLGCDVGTERITCDGDVCVYMHICVCARGAVHAWVSELMVVLGIFFFFFASSQWPPSIFLIIPCSCCCLCVTMETLVAIHQPISAEGRGC